VRQRVGLRGRLITTYLLLVTIGLGIFVLRYGWITQDSLVSEFQKTEQVHVLLIGTSLASPMESYVEGDLSLDRLERLVDELAVGVDGRITLLDARGNALYDTVVDITNLSNQWQQIEVQTALARQAEYDIRADPVAGDERLFVAAPVSLEGQVLGVVQLSVPISAMRARIRQAWLSLLGTAVVVVAVTILASLALAGSILRPVQALRRAAVRMAGGDLTQQLSVERNDELGDLAKAFNGMAMRLQHLMNQQRDFVANASHELRTPLTTVKLRVEALMGGARRDPAMVDRFLAEMEGEVNRLSHLVEELLALSRVEAGIDLLKMERVSLSLVLGQAVAAFYPQAEAAHVTLTLDAAPDLPPVKASASHVRQVVDNLLDNALKHTQAGGLITVSARPTGSLVTASVTDTGHGIPAQDLPHVFDRFYRADRARPRSGAANGAGLGLAIVRSIVEAHGGEVGIESQEGKGTSVRFTLPRYQGQ
jgi:signal transduction histidine kinase